MVELYIKKCSFAKIKSKYIANFYKQNIMNISKERFNVTEKNIVGNYWFGVQFLIIICKHAPP